VESPKYDSSLLNFAFSAKYMLWTLSKQSGCVQNCLGEFKLVWTYLFWTGPKCFGTDPKHLFTTGFHILKQVQNFGPVQNNLDQSKIILDKY